MDLWRSWCARPPEEREVGVRFLGDPPYYEVCMIRGWKCKRCGNTKTEGCGMPDYTVPVPFENGVEMLHPACPLEPVGLTKLYWKIKFMLL